ncbi:MAG: rRNA maturation RNase YbeY [Culturomica sp.]|jgi:rRNA maturation RNase YbeY|nr:rRNA maturation RNase YbeY [Culturomica sp.]
MEEISFYTENTEFPSFFSEKRLVDWFHAISRTYNVQFEEISFIFCNDDYILKMNQDYLQHDYYTDIITFDNSNGSKLSGDMFISLDTVLSNSEEYKVTYEDEFYRVVCHGLLHLIGFKDKTDKDAKLMRIEEEKCLNLLHAIRNYDFVAEI